MILGTDVENVVVFVDDAVRYDFARDRLSELGQTHETVAASLHTPASFASLFSGLHVPAHGVTSFRERFDDGLFSLFDLDGVEDYTVALSPFRGMNDTIASIFGDPPRATHREVEPPFVWLHRSPGGHAPYGEFEYPEGYSAGRNSREYLRDVVGDTERIRRDYERGVEQSIDYFDSVVDDVRDRGLIDDTLFVYTSDHGELLGEYGFLGHNHVACPELVKVPTTFVHPDVEPGLDHRLLHNVDVVPIVATLLDLPVPDVDGFDSLEKRRERGYNHFENVFYTTGLDRFDRVVRSLWDADGGRVRHEGGRLQATAIFFGLLAKSIHGQQIRASGKFLEAYRRFTGSSVYGTPGFTAADFTDILDRLEAGDLGSADRRELSGAEVDNLKDLGYL